MPRRPEPRCPIRVGEPCTLCFPGAEGPQDCGLVYLVQSDPELRAELAVKRAQRTEQRRPSTGEVRSGHGCPSGRSSGS